MFGAKYVPFEAKVTLCSSEVLSVLLHGGELRCLTQKCTLMPLRNRHNKPVPEIRHVTMYLVEV